MIISFLNKISLVKLEQNDVKYYYTADYIANKFEMLRHKYDQNLRYPLMSRYCTIFRNLLVQYWFPKY